MKIAIYGQSTTTETMTCILKQDPRPSSANCRIAGGPFVSWGSAEFGHKEPSKRHVCGAVCFSYLEPLVLQDLLDGHQLSRVTQLGLVHDAERAVPDHLGVRVADFLWPVGTLAWSGHDCRYLAAIFIP